MSEGQSGNWVRLELQGIKTVNLICGLGELMLVHVLISVKGSYKWNVEKDAVIEFICHFVTLLNAVICVGSENDTNDSFVTL